MVRHQPRMSTFCLHCDMMLSDVTVRDEIFQTFPLHISPLKAVSIGGSEGTERTMNRSMSKVSEHDQENMMMSLWKGKMMSRPASNLPA